MGGIGLLEPPRHDLALLEVGVRSQLELKANTRFPQDLKVDYSYEVFYKPKWSNYH